MAEALAANPKALRTAANLACQLASTDIRRAYATAMAALIRGERAGHDFAPSILALTAGNLVQSGALGPNYRLGAARPLFARARLLLDASKRSGGVPVQTWQYFDTNLAQAEAQLARLAAEGDDAQFVARQGRVTEQVLCRQCYATRCARCYATRCARRAAEMLSCSRCEAWLVDFSDDFSSLCLLSADLDRALSLPPAPRILLARVPAHTLAGAQRRVQGGGGGGGGAPRRLRRL